MNASIQSYPAVAKPTGFLRLAPLLSRIPLLIVAVVFTLISIRYLSNPVRAAASEGISFASPGGVTAARIGFAAFPLAFALIAFFCLLSTRRLLTGLYVILTVVATGTAVRVSGILLDHSAHEGGRLLVPEFVLLILFVAAIRLEWARQRLTAKI